MCPINAANPVRGDAAVHLKLAELIVRLGKPDLPSFCLFFLSFPEKLHTMI